LASKLRHLNWKNHIDQLVPKLQVQHVMHFDLCYILSIYFSCFHSLMTYLIIFWGNSSDSKKVFALQKKIVIIMMGVKSHNSCRGLFKRLEILPLPCKYIFLLINFITNKQVHFQTNAVYTVLTQETSTIFIDQLLSPYAFRKSLESKFSIIFHLVSKVLWMKKHSLK
jgi:hypothetical protein